MAWDFETDPEFQQKLDWVDKFVREEVEPLDLVWPYDNYKPLDDEHRRIVNPLKQRVREQGLWACHLEPALGGQGYGQLKLALLNEILGRSTWAPIIFGTQAPDTGNAEILAHFGTEEQKARYLQPLLNGEIFSCYSMTEPQGGADVSGFATTAVRDGEDWIINGKKFFSSNARYATFCIVMAYTDKEAGPHKGMSMFLVPTDSPGFTIERNFALIHEPIEEASEALIHYDNVRVPATAMLGEEGKAFEVAQVRLGGGRVHHAMRTVGLAQRALDMMCERALSRTTRGKPLADRETVQTYIAESFAQLQQFRLFVLQTAWLIDKTKDYSQCRTNISAIKFLTPKVLHDIVQRSIQIHGALGVTRSTPLYKMWVTAPVMGLVDGPTEVHLRQVARGVLKGYQGTDGMWPTEFLPDKVEAAKQKLGLA
ncbi:acyl-CoA dehydrogenase family protein [Rhodococcus oxybenzonivorans]|uniref:acyl-CoA dehydrogenase family protein n=1 Tax=Rhodococcus oxybenzonivorans TaxID=1990687 RepID=UPI002954778A|nr:acyl-CoA dehydrogenase family protein [Rhodococcus oxybenzonivorans]MDV7352758.1 acyl-CoA dehydrogenase family protein [Rhodococcus oxybenzonivorans]